MDEANWQRYAALGGIAFVVLNVAGTFIAGAPPSLDDSPQKVAEYFSDNAGALQAAQYLAGIGAIGLFWWFGSLWRRMTRNEAERPRLAVVALIGLVFGGVFALASGAVTSMTAMRIDDLSPEAARIFWALAYVLIGTSGFGIVAMLAAVSALSYKTNMLPQWLTVIGWVAAAGFLVASVSAASDADVFGFIGLSSFLLWCIWIVAISLLMFREEPPVSVAA
jgi:MFS family permease